MYFSCIRAGAARKFSTKKSAGFSLLEMLLVIVIIGLGVAIVGVSVGNNKPQELRNNARDFANSTALVEEEAVLSREPWGVQIYRAGQTDDGTDRIAYRFLRLTDNGWVPDHPRDVAAGGEFADNVIAELEVEGAEQLIEPLPKNSSADDASSVSDTNRTDSHTDGNNADTDKTKASVGDRNKTHGTSEKMKLDSDKKKTDPNMPTLWLAPGGEVTPFELRLRFKGDDKGPIVRSDALGRIQLEIKDDEENR